MTLRPYSQALQEAYRATLLTPGAPESIDDSVPVMPVAIVGGNQNTPTKGQSNQRILTAVTGTAAGANSLQIASVSTGNKVYLMGYQIYNALGVAQVVSLRDAQSGGAVPVMGGTLNNGDFFGGPVPAISGHIASANFTVPIPCNSGIRWSWAAAAAPNVICIVQYMLEDA